MILQALNSYYERLAAENSDSVPLYGFAAQNISFCLAFDAASETYDVEDYRLDQKGSPGRPIIMPTWGGKISSNVKAQLLWGKPAYVLGAVLDDKAERTRKSHDDFLRLSRLFFSRIPSDLFTVDGERLLAALPSDWRTLRYAGEFKPGQLFTFKIAGQSRTLAEQIFKSPVARSEWCKIRDAESAFRGQCLVTGSKAPIARTHLPVKGTRSTSSHFGGPGILGSEKAELALVSFNKDKTAFTSFGKLQNFNAPVSEQAAFQYATALNHLLRAGSRQRLVIGDSTTVFWSEKESPAEDLFAYLLDPAAAATEAPTTEMEDRLHVLLSQIAQGAKPSEFGETSSRFYILGLAPNAARLVVRFWHVATLGELLENIGDHFANLRIPRGPKDPEFPAIWQLLRESAREPKDISPLLTGAVARAIFAGTAYPLALPVAIINRIRVDHRINATRAGILKAFVIRNYNEPMNAALQQDHPELSYHLGRLFAVFEQAQRQAHEFKLERTIQDTFLSAASATPSLVFPRLHRLHIHHLRKLPGGSRKFYEDRIRDIEQRVTGLPTTYPSSLSLRQQGVFFIGYYHQMYELKRKASERTEPHAKPEEID